MYKVYFASEGTRVLCFNSPILEEIFGFALSIHRASNVEHIVQIEDKDGTMIVYFNSKKNEK